jgi:chromosome segregation ATPase
LLEVKNKELESKDKVIFSVGGTNKKLLNELEELKKEVDEKLDKIGLKQIKDTEKEIELKKKQQPLEHLLKVKEKELKNALTLLDVLKKDKENLQKNLNEKSDFNKVISLQDKLKEEENKNIQLETEIKLIQKLKDEHNKCENVKAEFEKEKKQMANEMKFLKEKNKELKNKIKEEEQKIGELSTKLAESKSSNTTPNVLITQNTNPTQSNQNNLNLPNIKNNDPKSKNLNKVNTSQELQNLQKYWNMLESADKIGAKDDSAIVQKKKLPKTDKEYKDFLSKERHKFSHSLQNKNFKMPESSEARPKLFGNEEKQILSKLLPTNEISKLEKKFEMIDSSKAALERKYATEVKTLNKKVSDLEDRLEMTLLQNKEAEQKNKILSFQINEHKNENKILSRKLVELNNKIKGIKAALNEKEDENKRLIKQLQESHNNLRKLEEGGNSISKTYNESNIEDLEEHEVVHEPTEEHNDEPQETDLVEDQMD